jgi:hypothetical protein
VGVVEFLQVTDNGREVYRLAGNLPAINTSMAFWVSYFATHQERFTEEIMRNVAHSS